ncbi:MAG: hypothetical protein F6K47_03715 [Symploca sp. SIO2E6]|nr:hypothetical protein [Symploca sp. SIO2E6]
MTKLLIYPSKTKSGDTSTHYSLLITLEKKGSKAEDRRHKAEGSKGS